jgi:serine/threonine protein phosphatase PrpC
MGTLTLGRRAVDKSPYLDIGVASAALAGQKTSGDLHLVAPRNEGTLVAVIDGLGHGPEAGAAAERAAATLSQHSHESVIQLVRSAHQALIGTRGVAMSLAAFSAAEDTLAWLAIGNVEGILLRGDPAAKPRKESVVMRGGVVGYELPIVRAAVTTLMKGDVLIFATDGIEASFTHELNPSERPQELADQILADFSKGTDDALVMVARYLGKSPTQA